MIVSVYRIIRASKKVLCKKCNKFIAKGNAVWKGTAPMTTLGRYIYLKVRGPFCDQCRGKVEIKF